MTKYPFPPPPPPPFKDFFYDNNFFQTNIHALLWLSQIIILKIFHNLLLLDEGDRVVTLSFHNKLIQKKLMN